MTCYSHVANSRHWHCELNWVNLKRKLDRKLKFVKLFIFKPHLSLNLRFNELPSEIFVSNTTVILQGEITR